MEHIQYTIVALPYRPTVEQQKTAQFAAVSSLLGPQLGPAVRLLPMPQLKVGTLDSLIEASDDLGRLDAILEAVSFRLCTIVEEVAGVPRAVAATIRQTGSAHGTPCDHVLKEIAWNTTTYDPSESIPSLCRKFGQVAQAAEERTRGILTEYAETKNKLANAQRKFAGNLSMKPIKEPVDAWCKSLGIPKPWDTDFFTTMFIAIPTGDPLQRWQTSYASINDFVVPQSSYVLAADKEYTLVTLVCFKKVVEDVKTHCRRNKFFIREYAHTDDISVADFEALQVKAKQEREKLAVLLSQQFSHCFTAWVHVKVARVFVEAHLKFGAAAHFVPVMLAVDDKREVEIRSRLDAAYKEILYTFAIHSEAGTSHGGDGGALVVDAPYVCLKVGNILKLR